MLIRIPRDMRTLPGLTTNIEFGEYLHSGKIVVGFPETSDNNRYIYYRCAYDKIPCFNSLEECVDNVLSRFSNKHDIVFTADTHFSSKRTLELCMRPFSSVKEMDWQLISNWNSVVSDDDIVYHLGDFGDSSIAKHLNGKIFLIPGNYDNSTALDELRRFNVQNIVGDDENSKVISVESNEFRLMHMPIFINEHNDDIFSLFGHIHKAQMVKAKALNVGVDCHNFTPISLETVMFYKKAILEYYDENVFC